MEKYILTNILISENKVTINSLLTFRTFRGFGWRGGFNIKPKTKCRKARLLGNGSGFLLLFALPTPTPVLISREVIVTPSYLYFEKGNSLNKKSVP